jgi:hypothetical protein
VTTQQLHLFNCLYLVILAAVAVLTRATPRRIAGALAGSTACGAVAVLTLASGVIDRWWHIVMRRDLYFIILLWIDFALCGYVFLLTWRIARRFGGLGLAAVLVVSAVIGPARDYRYLAMFPKWGSHASGFAPVFAISGAYVFLLILGHGVMRVVAGPAIADRLARRPWQANQSPSASRVS